MQPKDRDALEDALKKLRSITESMRFNALVVAALTVLNLLVLAAIYPLLSLVNPLSLVMLGGVVTLIVGVAAANFEVQRKQGDTLFKEASDELQWNVRFGGDAAGLAAAQPPAQRPDFNYRLTLRSFAQGSEMPLIPGRLGPLMYILLNLAFLLFSVMIDTLGRHAR